MAKEIVVRHGLRGRVAVGLYRLALAKPDAELPERAELLALVRVKGRKLPLTFAVYRHGGEYFLTVRVPILGELGANRVTREELAEVLAPAGIML